MAFATGSGNRSSDRPIEFGRRVAGSEGFKDLFREGMALVEEAAAYLDGDGRRESKSLSRPGSMAYATESMRLTTRLMQLASWLLLQRAVNEGEMTSDQARLEKAKVKLNGFDSATEGPGWDGLPERLQFLIRQSLRLQERIRRLDQAIDPKVVAVADDPVGKQIGQLAAALGATRDQRS